MSFGFLIDFPWVFTSHMCSTLTESTISISELIERFTSEAKITENHPTEESESVWQTLLRFKYKCYHMYMYFNTQHSHVPCPVNPGSGIGSYQ